MCKHRQTSGASKMKENMRFLGKKRVKIFLVQKEHEDDSQEITLCSFTDEKMARCYLKFYCKKNNITEKVEGKRDCYITPEEPYAEAFIKQLKVVTTIDSKKGGNK